MKYLFNGVLFLTLLLNISPIFQEWNLENASYNLLSASNDYKYLYIIYNKTVSNYEVILTKYIQKVGNIIQDYNILDIVNKENNNEKYSNNVIWEDIDNVIFYNNTLHICPKGSFHPFYYSNKNLNNHTMYNFPDNFNLWDLKCFLYDNLLVAIYSKNEFLYSYNPNLEGWTKISFDFKLNDLLWNQIKTSDENNYQLPGLTIFEDNSIALSNLNFLLDFSIGLGIESYNNLTKFSDNSLSYFEGNNKLYFLFYDSDNLISGYYNDNKEINIDNIQNIKPNINEPLDIKGTQLLDINSIKGTRYIFYKIRDNNLIYFGIFDIITNQILFNVKENINKFIPLSKYSMLVITDNSAYEICVISVDGKCIEKCENDEIVINPEGKNYCKCPNIYFIPGYKCLYSCDLNFYVNDTNKCGLCKHLGGNKIYKLINTTGCLEEKPNNTIFYDEDLLLLICDNNYHLENGTCILNSTEEEENIDNNNTDEEEIKEEEIDYIIIIFITSVSFLFFIISFFICKKLWGKGFKSEKDLLSQIDTVFEPKDTSIN